MAGFASLLDQFKQTTAAVASATKRPHPSPHPAASDDQSASRNDINSANNGTQKIQKQHQTYQYPGTPVQTIYIACPANTETGGPEALHQLCHVINEGSYLVADVHVDDVSISTSPAQRNNGKKKKPLKAYMLYLRERNNNPSSSSSSVEHVPSPRARPEKYAKYNAPIAEWLPGSLANKSSVGVKDDGYSSELVVWPECWTHLIDSLQPPSTPTTRKYQCAIWWLSVNNNKGRFLPEHFKTRKDILHLVQSDYARDYVVRNLSSGGRAVAAAAGGGAASMGEDERRVLDLTEFIPYASPSFSSAMVTTVDNNTDANETTNSRDLDVVYNTVKGMHYTDEIMRRACGKKFKTASDGSAVGGGIRFSPIGKGVGGRERLSGEEVVALLKRAKVVSLLYCWR